MNLYEFCMLEFHMCFYHYDRRRKKDSLKVFGDKVLTEYFDNVKVTWVTVWNVDEIDAFGGVGLERIT
jgi:hypothetical protein